MAFLKSRKKAVAASSAAKVGGASPHWVVEPETSAVLSDGTGGVREGDAGLREAGQRGTVVAEGAEAVLRDPMTTTKATPSAGDTGVYEADPGSKQARNVAKGDKVVVENQTVKVTPPGGWVHMDVLERDKWEWTTDVPPAPPTPELDRTEARFSFSGLVIPRTVTTIPSHMGLHHHGNEPQVRHHNET